MRTRLAMQPSPSVHAVVSGAHVADVAQLGEWADENEFEARV